MNNFTNCFPGSVNPQRTGAYQIQTNGMSCDCCWIYSQWDGDQWDIDQDGNFPHEIRKRQKQVKRWRELTKAAFTAASKGNASARTHAAMQEFARKMQACCTVRDGVLTARIIGEFSSGKTRLLRELLGAHIPVHLLPVSSLERQTRLQLEITYGEQATLTLVERASDTEPAKQLKEFSHFPTRDELDGTHHDPRLHRLRLAIPEKKLLLPDGDRLQEERVPMRLFLIDTPGWSSGEDEIAEDDANTFFTGYHNLALVYVSTASRVDGAASAQRLREFLQAMDDADFLGNPNLLFVVTHCSSVESAIFNERARKMVRRFWEEIAGDKAIDIHVICIDFGDQSTDGEQQLAHFRAEFWQHLLAPLGNTDTLPEHPWLYPIRQWSAGHAVHDWDIRPRLRESHEQIQRIKALLARARSDGEFVAKFNMTRLLGCNPEEARGKVRTRWMQQLEVVDHNALVNLIVLPDALHHAHPLADWWEKYWQTGFYRCLDPVSQFFARFELALAQLTPQTKDLNAHFQYLLNDAYDAAQQALDGSFTRMVEAAAPLVNHSQPEKVVATVLALSILEARYCDHYHGAQMRLAKEALGKA